MAGALAKVNREPLYAWYKGIDPANVIYAVNCGSDEPLTDMSGVTWMPDTGAVGGVKSGEGGNQRWVMPNTDIYQTERWGDQESFTYKIPFDVMIDGTYTLILKFSEQYFWEPGQKVFDVAVGDVDVLKNLDPFARAGSKLLPYDAFIVLQARRGELFYNTEKIKNAVKKDNTLNVHFKVGTADNPKVNAIALIKGGLENTHKENFDLFQQTLIAIQEEKA